MSRQLRTWAVLPLAGIAAIVAFVVTAGVVETIAAVAIVVAGWNFVRRL